MPFFHTREKIKVNKATPKKLKYPFQFLILMLDTVFRYIDVGHSISLFRWYLKIFGSCLKTNIFSLSIIFVFRKISKKVSFARSSIWESKKGTQTP